MSTHRRRRLRRSRLHRSEHNRIVQALLSDQTFTFAVSRAQAMGFDLEMFEPGARLDVNGTEVTVKHVRYDQVQHKLIVTAVAKGNRGMVRIEVPPAEVTSA